MSAGATMDSNKVPLVRETSGLGCRTDDTWFECEATFDTVLAVVGMLQVGLRNRFAAVVCSALLLSSSSSGQAPALSDIANQVKKSQRALLNIPGGFHQDYSVTTVNHPEDSALYWGEIPEAFWNVKYPNFYGEALMSYLDKNKTTRYSTQYDFVTKVSFNGTKSLTPRASPLNVQFLPYPSTYLKSFCHPLSYLFYPEGETFAFEGTEGPRQAIVHCLKAHAAEYRVAPGQQLRGVECIKLTRPNWDELWLVPKFGYTMIRRKVFDGQGVLKSEYDCSNFKLVSSGVWQPQQIIRIDHDGNRTATSTLMFQPMRIGVAEKELRMAIPIGSHVDDQYRAKFYTLSDLSEGQMERSLASARRALPMRQSQAMGLTIVGLVGALIAYFVRPSKRKKY